MNKTIASRQRRIKINPIARRRRAFIQHLNNLKIRVKIQTAKAIRKILSLIIATRRKMKKVIRTLIRMKQVKNK